MSISDPHPCPCHYSIHTSEKLLSQDPFFTGFWIIYALSWQTELK